MESKKLDNSSGLGPEVAKSQRVDKERVAQKVHRWTMQNEMRDVMGRVYADTAGRILDSAYSREKRANNKLCPLQ